MTTSKLIQKSHLNSKKDSSKEINFFLNYELWWEKFKQYHMKKQYFIQTQKQQPMKDLTKILKDGDEAYYTVTGSTHIVKLKKYFLGTEISICNNDEVMAEIDHLNENGSKNEGGECLIFPSKEERNWDNFKRKEEFKRGDWGLFWDDGDDRMIGQYWGVNDSKFYEDVYPHIVANYDKNNGLVEGNAYENFEKIDIKDYI